MIIELLRAGTRQAHQELENEMLPFIKGVTSTVAYARLLELFYGYYHPLESGVSRFLDESVLPDINERRKTDWILNDLRALQRSTVIRVDDNAPSIESLADALGAMYVMEGSSLGGKIICRIIAGNLDYKDEAALSFFNGYGSGTASKWKDFLSVLDRFSGSPHEAAIVTKANEVFSKFQIWLKFNKL